MRTIQALLTDLDGTLIHSVDPICDALHECFLHVGATPPAKQQLVDMFGLPVERHTLYPNMKAWLCFARRY